MESRRIDTVQINVGKLCNQACRHCHVEAGPKRTEVMSRETVEAVMEVVERHRVATVDITGGAPEMNPSFDCLIDWAC
ncbi:MAG: radical SAM protein [Armatimonadetes bacterium]|nr:radical SAM protein [Armatimonadota bacterium]